MQSLSSWGAVLSTPTQDTLWVQEHQTHVSLSKRLDFLLQTCAHEGCLHRALQSRPDTQLLARPAICPQRHPVT